MWTNEFFFSEGDMCDISAYLDELRERSSDGLAHLQRRREHLLAVRERLDAEADLLLDMMCNIDDIIDVLDFDEIFD